MDIAVSQLKEVLELYSEQFPDTEFKFSFSNIIKKWLLFVNDYETYTSNDFSEVSIMIRESLEIKYIAVYLKDFKINDEFKVFISK